MEGIRERHKKVRYERLAMDKFSHVEGHPELQLSEFCGFTLRMNHAFTSDHDGPSGLIVPRT